MCEKFRDYLIGSKFTVLTDNNPLTYVHTSRLGVSQIRWLLDLALFDFDIKYRVGKSNQAADALSWRPANPDSASESSDDEEEWEAISYEMVSPLIFAQMCTLYHQSKDQDVQPDSHTTNSITNQQNNEIHVTTSNINNNPITEDFSPKDAILGQVWIGNPCKVICIPANSVKVVEGETSSKACQLSCMIEARSQHNLPLGVMVNCTTVTPSKSKKVPVTLINTNSYNVWIRQQLLAADIVEVDHCPWDYHSTMFRDGGDVQVLFQPVPTPDVQANISSVNATQTEKKAGDKETTKGVYQEERPKFGPRPKFNSKNFDFKKELE